MTDRASSHGPQLPLELVLAPGAVFDAYQPGENGFTVGMLREMAAGTGERQVYLHGGPGLGKSHLLQAACRACVDRGSAAAYLPLGDRDGLEPLVLEGFEAMALVALDDVGAIAGDEPWERALFSLINAVRASGARIILAGASTPAALGLSLPDLVSRLAWGPVLRLAPLDDPEKRVALRARAEQLGMTLPENVVEYLVRRERRDLATLLARVDELDRASLAAGRRLTIPFVREVFGDGPSA